MEKFVRIPNPERFIKNPTGCSIQPKQVFEVSLRAQQLNSSSFKDRRNLTNKNETNQSFTTHKVSDKGSEIATLHLNEQEQINKQQNTLRLPLHLAVTQIPKLNLSLNEIKKMPD